MPLRVATGPSNEIAVGNNVSRTWFGRVQQGAASYVLAAKNQETPVGEPAHFRLFCAAVSSGRPDPQADAMMSCALM
ncbi:hypothetical protein MPLDJ20_150009 [Mesorhizobium plurifarium]|uniref:Uncharacterized protein n=1 Tax=Mesorhizobium plurifarium TaxID=69974 RepID=A0A090GIJ5_MESPL|nr:hypothetical protein MPLDJ20_150009 [Mesorhizobium plurifarium]